MKVKTMAQWMNLLWNSKFLESADYALIMRKNWSPTPSATRSYGRQAGSLCDQIILALKILKFSREQTWKHYICLNEDIAFLVALLA